MESALAPPQWWKSGWGALRRVAPRRIEYAKTIALMPADRELEILMARYQAGDFAAARALIEMLSPQLRRFFVVQIASRAEADDLLQETWLRIHKVRHTYRQSEPVLPWIYAIARYIRIDHFRRVVRTNSRERSLDEIANPEPVLARGPQDREGVETLLAALPAGQREVIELLKIEGLSLEEVARATSTTVGSVKQKAHRAYEKLRRAMSAWENKKSARGEES
jgi:RNA polymerase sigma-70 factor (ECF subfamily)